MDQPTALDEATFELITARLREAGLVRRRRVGSRDRDEIADPIVLDLCETVCEGIAAQLASRHEALAAITEEVAT